MTLNKRVKIQSMTSGNFCIDGLLIKTSKLRKMMCLPWYKVNNLTRGRTTWRNPKYIKEN